LTLAQYQSVTPDLFRGDRDCPRAGPWAGPGVVGAFSARNKTSRNSSIFTGSLRSGG